MDKALISYKLPADVVEAWRAYIASLSGMNVKRITGDWNIKKKVGSSKHGDVVLEAVLRDYLQKEGVEV